MALTPASLYLTLYRGTDFSVIITCQDSAAAAVDLTGCTFVGHVRSIPSGSLIKSLAPAVTDASAGEITITLTDTETLAIAAGDYVWDLFMQDATGIRSGPYVAGRLTVREPVSKFS